MSSQASTSSSVRGRRGRRGGHGGHGQTLCASLGAVSTPSSPYRQQANSVERVVQTVHRVLQVMALPSKAHWDRRLLPSVKLAINSSPSSVTGHRRFDLVFISHPTVVHGIFDAEEHLGVGSFAERLSAAQDRLAEARQHITTARLEQKRRYDSRRTTPTLIVPGMSAWVRLRDRPCPLPIRNRQPMCSVRLSLYVGL
ncbi:hypothetical protein A4X06_0g7919 [Tilletia controversa]|uniref:Uncharacterized protein n=2 Tax=Tilletia TaxID=13289 RepID=A0A8X7STP2_9BASI|nr:hypothetical protein CF328_g8760 [Tilletia controversa]KAE8183367.1 hypothetical protein CF335_g8342 [Tilletia laevis]KAE8184712.1 hypothetical protein CF336_g7689 [Tilletia laevis]KAE8240079.1 hypothetical protein A4X06_0g7919 [Tilletia controversa]KAE8253077.1 hypothetical protein A4X03_0g5992 [Tilletia caries]